MQKTLGDSTPGKERTKEEAEEQSEGKGGGGRATSSLHEKNAIICVLSFIFPFVLLILSPVPPDTKGTSNSARGLRLTSKLMQLPTEISFTFSENAFAAR